MPLKFNAIFKCLITCFCLSVMMACAKKESSNNELNSGLTDETGAHFVAGQIFSDRITKGLYGPELIVIAGKSFTQGAIKKDKQAQDNEKPAHQVEFNKLFSISRSEITVAQFRVFVEITNYKTKKNKNNRGTDCFVPRNDETIAIMNTLKLRNYKFSYKVIMGDLIS